MCEHKYLVSVNQTAASCSAFSVFVITWFEWEFAPRCLQDDLQITVLSCCTASWLFPHDHTNLVLSEQPVHLMAEVANAADAELGGVAGQVRGEDQALPLNSGTKTDKN